MSNTRCVGVLQRLWNVGKFHIAWQVVTLLITVTGVSRDVLGSIDCLEYRVRIPGRYPKIPAGFLRANPSKTRTTPNLTAVDSVLKFKCPLIEHYLPFLDKILKYRFSSYTKNSASFISHIFLELFSNRHAHRKTTQKNLYNPRVALFLKTWVFKPRCCKVPL